MSGKFTVTLAAGLLVTTSMAFAATATTAKKAHVGKKPVAVERSAPAASEAAPSDEDAPIAAATPSPVNTLETNSITATGMPSSSSAATLGKSETATSVGTSTASLSATAPAATRKIKGEFASLVQMGAADLHRHNGAPSTANYLGIKRVIDANKAVSLRQTFAYNFPTGRATSNVLAGDAYFNYVDAKLLTFGKGSLIFNPRLILPTGETTRFYTKHRGGAYTHLIATYPVGKIDLNYNLKGAIYNQSQDNYIDREGKLKANKQSYYEQFAEATLNVSDNFALTQSAGTTGEFYRPMGGKAGANPTKFLAETTFSFIAPKLGAQLDLGISNEVDIATPSTPFQVMRESDLTYFAALSASI